MKTSIKLILAAVILGAFIIHAQQPPVPVTITPTIKQYKVVDLSQISAVNGRSVSGTLEAMLNQMGSQGWKLVTFSGNLVVMMQ